MSSARGGRHVKDALGHKLPASRKKSSRRRFDLSMPLRTVYFLRLLCKYEDVMTTYTWTISHISFSNVILAKNFLPVQMT
jgi:hypothetical protein